MQELMVLPEEEKALEAVFIEGSDFDPVIEKIREQAKDLPVDMAVKKNRDEVASFAYKIARSKTAVEKAGAAISAKYKELPKKIDASRRAYKNAFEQLQDEVRAPLNKWEEVEAERIEKHQFALSSITENSELSDECPAKTIKDVLDDISSRVIDESWEEFEQEAHRAKAAAIAKLTEALDKRTKREAELAELEALRKQAEERAQKEREEKAAAEAKAEAEKAAAKAVEDAKRAEEQAKRELELAEQRRIAQEKQAELDKAEAERLALARVEMAREQEAKRHAEKQAQLEAEKAAREADTEHKAAINRAALAALTELGLEDEQAKSVIIAIAKNQIPNVTINY